MSLRLTEKEFWIDRLVMKVSEQRERLLDEFPDIQDDIREEARENLYVELGLTALKEALGQAREEEDTARNRAADLANEMYAIVFGEEPPPRWQTSSTLAQIEREINNRTTGTFQTLREQHPMFAPIIELERLRGEVRGTIMLISSHETLKNYAQRMYATLGLDPSEIDEA